MKITLKGYVQTVSRIISKTAPGGKTLRLQTLLLKVPSPKNEFGDAYGKDELWQVELINDAIEKHNLLAANLQSKKVELACWLNSRAFKKDGEEQYALQLRLADYKVLP